MHPDLSPHLHTDKCNLKIAELQNCYKEHQIGKFFGQCSSLYKQMTVCLKDEREIYRKRNQEKAKERQEKQLKNLAELKSQSQSE